MNELRFGSTKAALQHLANLTGKKVRVAEGEELKVTLDATNTFYDDDGDTTTFGGKIVGKFPDGEKTYSLNGQSDRGHEFDTNIVRDIAKAFEVDFDTLVETDITSDGVYELAYTTDDHGKLTVTGKKGDIDSITYN